VDHALTPPLPVAQVIVEEEAPLYPVAQPVAVRTAPGVELDPLKVYPGKMEVGTPQPKVQPVWLSQVPPEVQEMAGGAPA